MRCVLHGTCWILKQNTLRFVLRELIVKYVLCTNCEKCIVHKFSYPIIGLDMPLGLRRLRPSEFLNTRHMYVVGLSALRTIRLYPTPTQGDIPSTHFC